MEYDTESSVGDRLNARVRNLQSPWPAALRLFEGLWGRDGMAGCMLIANNGRLLQSTTLWARCFSRCSVTIKFTLPHNSMQFHEASDAAHPLTQ